MKRKQNFNRVLSFFLSFMIALSSIPMSVFAYMAEKPDSIAFIDSNGDVQQIDSESWTEKFPYGTFAFSNSELTMTENGNSEVIEVYRLGGTKGKVTAYISYAPFVANNDGELSYFNAIGGDDIIISVEDPSPYAKDQKVGRDKPPLPVTSGTAIYAAFEEGEDVHLTVDADADSYQWYARSAGGRWKAVNGAEDDTLPVAKEDLQYTDIFLEYVKGENTYRTNSFHGEIYIPEENFYDETEFISGDYEPAYTDLDLKNDEYGTKYFEVVFSEGEWVKEIYVTPVDNKESNPERLATFTIYDCEGGELYDSANTMILTLLDDEDTQQTAIGFEVTQIYTDTSEGVAKATVKRTGGMNHLITVDYTTEDDTAIEGKDYIKSAGTLKFYGEETEQTIEVPLMNASAEKNEAVDFEALNDEQKSELKKFSIVLSGLKGGEGKDVILPGKEKAVVSLYNSGKSSELNLADILNDGDAVNVSGNMSVADNGLIPNNDNPVAGMETDYEKSSLKGAVSQTLSPYVTFGLRNTTGTENKTVTFSRNTVQDYGKKYWENFSVIAKGKLTGEALNEVEKLGWVNAENVNNGSSIKIENKDAATGYAYIPDMAKKFGKVYMNTHLRSYNVWINPWVIPRISLAYRDGNGNMTSDERYRLDGERSEDWTVGARTVYPWRDFYPDITDNINSIYLEIREVDGESGGPNGNAIAEITDGYLERRIFNNSQLNIALYHANSENNVKPGEAVFEPGFTPDIEIAEGKGGINSNGQIYVGSGLNAKDDRQGLFEQYKSKGGVYLTKANSPTVLYDSSASDRSIKMLWNNMTYDDLNSSYTINMVYERYQDAIIDLSTSVPVKDENGNPLTDTAKKEAEVKTLNDFIASVKGEIEYGYKSYDNNSRKFIDKTERIYSDQIRNNSDQQMHISFMRTNNLQWINFNLPEEDRIVFNGKTYKGNQRIQFDGNDMTMPKLQFLYYDSEFIGVEREAKVNINTISVYLDADGDEKISGMMENNIFKLEPGRDTFIENINLNENYDESVFAPVIKEDGTVLQKYMKVMYTVTPRSIAEIPGKENVAGQILPAFTSNLTNETSVARSTREQKDYRFIKAAKDIYDNYLSDDVTIYGAKATLLNMIDFPLGGDHKPYEIKDGNTIWTPEYKGNLIFEYENPEIITLNNTVMGDGFNLTTDFEYSPEEGYTYTNNGESTINGYLGSYVGNTVFSLVIREQNEEETMEKLIAGTGVFSNSFDSVAIGGRGTFQTPNGLLNMNGSGPEMNFNSAEESPGTSRRSANNSSSDAPEGFDIDLGMSLPEINLENILSLDGVGVYMDGNRIGFTVGTPLGDDFADNFNYKKKLMDPDESYAKGKENAAANPDSKGAVASKEYGMSFSMSAAFYWEYDPVVDKFHFAEAGISVTAGFEFSLQYRFTFCPLIYCYVKTGISVSVGAGLGRNYYEVENDESVTLTAENPAGTALPADLKKDKVYTFETEAKAVNFYFKGKLSVEIYGEDESLLRRGILESVNKIEKSNINIDRLINLPDGEKVTVKIKVMEDSRVESIKEVTDYDTIVYFKGFSLSPAFFIEVGAGIGIEIFKAEVFIKISVEATFVFGGYNLEDDSYDGAKVDSFDFMASIGVRVVAFLFTYELTGVGFSRSYDGDEDKWESKWIFLNDYLPKSRMAVSADGEEGSGIKPPQSPAGKQRLYGASTGNKIMRANSFGDNELPFKLSSFTESSASKLADGLNLGYDYKLVTVGNRNFLVYLYARDNAEGIHASMLVLSELAENEDGYALASPVTGNSELYTVDNDATGDLDFSVYANSDNIYITWLSYVKDYALSTTGSALKGAVENMELKRAVFNVSEEDFTDTSREVLTDAGTPVSMSDTLEDMVVYVNSQPYSDAEYDEARGEYYAYVNTLYNTEATQKVAGYLMDSWDARAYTEGKSSTVSGIIYTGSGEELKFAFDTKTNGRVVDISTAKVSEDTYWISYVTENNIVTEDSKDYATVKRLFIAEVKNNNGDVNKITPKLIKKIIDYDNNTEKEGELNGSELVKEIDNPTIGTVNLLSGKLSNGGDDENFLVFDFSGNTYIIGEASIKSLLNSGAFEAKPLFETNDGQASGKTEVNFGTDGAGNVLVVYVSKVEGTTNNALFVSKYDTEAEKFGAGQMLSMRHMDVYEYSYGEGKSWTEEELEKAYYGELESKDIPKGSMSTFSFSNIQVAFGKEKTNEEDGSFLIITTGTMSELKDADGYDTKIIDPNREPDVGFYALNFGVEHPAIGEQEVKFFINNFIEGSVLDTERIAFKNTGDVSFRASEEHPATVKMYAGKLGATSVIKEWTVKETVLPGKMTVLENGRTSELPEMGAGSVFYLEINEHDYYKESGVVRSSSTKDTCPLNVEEKTDIKLGDNIIREVINAEGNNVVIFVDFWVQNVGSKNSDSTYVQFSYKSGEDDDELIFTPLDITAGDLKVDDQVELNIMRAMSFTEDKSKGILELKGNDGTGIKSGYGRRVHGNIIVPKDVFNILTEGSFNLKIEAFDGEYCETGENAIVSSTGEHNNLNNYRVIPILPVTFFSTADNIAIPMGNVYKMPVGLSSTSKTSRVSAEEFAEEEEYLLGTVYYDYSGYINMMGSRQGSGIMRIIDSNTNSFKDIAFKTEIGDGINIYSDNGIFTFYNALNNPYNPDNPGQKWEFTDNIIEWGNPPAMPLRGDMSFGQKDAFFTFDTFANKIELYFTGEIKVQSDKYPEYIMGRTITSDKLADGEGKGKVIDFTGGSEANFRSHKVTITVMKGDELNPAVFDKMKEYYPGEIPVPDTDKGAPAILWSRNWPDKASLLKGSEKLIVSAFIYDPTGIASVEFNDMVINQSSAEAIEEITSLEKITEELWRVDFEFSENEYHKLKTADISNNISYDYFVLDCFENPVDDEAVSEAPDLKVEIADENGNAIIGGTSEDAYFKITSNGSLADASVYRLQRDAGSESGYTETRIGDVEGKIKIPANGYYRVILDGEDGSWNQRMLRVLIVDNASPIINFREETTNTFEYVNKDMRHLFYYATKETGEVEDGASPEESLATINEVFINGKKIEDTEPAKTISGYYHIAYGGKYTFKATDSSGRDSSLSLEINNFKVILKEGFIASVKSSTNQGKNNGEIKFDFSEIFGGNYANTAIDEGEGVYFGSYKAAVVEAESEFKGSLDSPEAKEYFNNIDWRDTEAYTGISPGEYVIYVRDATDVDFERNSTIASLKVTVEDESLGAQIYSTATANKEKTDGKIRVYPESKIEEPEYQVALAYVGDSEPASFAKPSDQIFEEWLEVEEIDVNNGRKKYIEITVPKEGWYQAAVKTKDMDTTANENDVFMEFVQVKVARRYITAEFESYATTTREKDDGIITVYPDSVLNDARYEAAVVYVGDTQPEELISFLEDIFRWKDVTETDEDNNPYIRLGGLQAGWHQVAVKTADVDAASDEDEIHMFLVEVEIGNKYVEATIESAGTTTQYKNDGKITVYPKSVIKNPEYEAAYAYRGDAQPADTLKPSDEIFESWLPVNKTDGEGQKYIDFTELQPGWYQIALKLRDMDVVSEEDQVYVDLVEVKKGHVSSSRPKKETTAEIEENETEIILNYEGEFSDINEETAAWLKEQNKTKNIIVISDSVYVVIPKGVLKEDGSINSMVANTSDIQDLEYSTVYFEDAEHNIKPVPFSLISDKVMYIAKEQGIYGITENRKDFDDIENHWAYDYINFVTTRGIFAGVGQNKFAPDDVMTRAMLVTILGKLSNISATNNIEKSTYFSDVENGSYYAPYVDWAHTNGIINGYGNNLFGTGDPITREQMCVMIYNYIKIEGLDMNYVRPLHKFNDAYGISSWAVEAVEYCYQAGIISGKGDNFFKPEDTASRAEVATIITNLIKAVFSK